MTTTTTTAAPTPAPTPLEAALVFGASGEEGRAVVEGLVNCGRYQPVYAFTRHKNQQHDTTAIYLRDGLGATLWSYKNGDDTGANNGGTGGGGGGGGADLENIDHVEQALTETRATAIFLVTTTELPTVIGQTSHGCSDAAEAEFQVIVNFCHILKRVHDKDGSISRHVVLSTRDNVQKAVRGNENDNRSSNSNSNSWIEPLDDGSIVPHYSAKGRGAEYAMEYLKDIPGLQLTLLTMPFFYSNFLGFFCPLPVLITTAAEEDEDEEQVGQEDATTITTTAASATTSACTQWTLSACFGNGNHKIDMMAASDLSILVPHIFAAPHKKYDSKNIRLVGQTISMNEIAKQFSDLFGKDVIYNPLSYQEVLNLPIPAAGPMAQMCLFLSDPRSLSHDLPATMELYHDSTTGHGGGGDNNNKKNHNNKTTPTTFADWLLTHSDCTAFTTTLLDLDAPTEILTVTVFGATTPEGISVTRGLLSDPRKQYTKIRMAITDKTINNNQSSDGSQKQATVAALFKAVLQKSIHKKNDISSEKEGDEMSIPKCLEVVHADLDDLESCRAAVQGVEGVFLVTDFFRRDNMMELEEAHAQNVIQACSSLDTTTSSMDDKNKKRVQHLVFCTMESVEEMEREHAQLQNDAVEANDTHLDKKTTTTTTTYREEQFHAKARTAALARTKKLSATYVLLPCYSELFFDLIQRRPVSPTADDDGETNDNENGQQEKEKLVLQVPTVMQQGEHKEGEETKVVCFSIDDLGPAVANIFDSYQVYAGHEIGLVTDFCTVSQVKEIIEQVFLQDKSGNRDGKIEIEHVHDNGDQGDGIDDKDGNNNSTSLPPQWKATDTYMKDLGQMFAYMARSDAVKRRHSIAKTMKLVPSARPLREWVEQNRDNPAFREKLGLR